MTERMQTVNEGEVESGLRPLDQQKGVVGESLPAQQGEQGRFTNVGGSSVAPQQQQSSLQQQQPLQGTQPGQSLATSQGQTPLTGQTGSQGVGQQGFPQQQGLGGQHPMGGQQGIGQQGMYQGVGQQGLGQQGVPVGQQQMGQQQMGQQQIGQQGQQVPMQNLAQQQQVATFAEVTIDDPLYEPQARILNMLDNQKRAFLRPYNLVSFNNQQIMRDDPTGVLYTLDQLRGVRIVCFPITKGVQGPIAAASTTPSTGLTGPTGGQVGGVGSGAQGGSAIAGPEHRSVGVALEEKAAVVATNIAHPVDSHHARQAQRQQGVQKMGTDTTTGATGVPVQGQQQFQDTLCKYRKGLLVTDMNLEIEPTSQVWGIDVPEDVTPNFWENKSARVMGPVNLGQLLTLNVSQIPSAANRALSSSPIDKPTRHLFIFGETSRSPVLIVERDLKPVRKCIRVFSKDLNVLCKIEGSTSLLRKKIIITGPDEETPIYTVKQKGLFKNFPGLKDSQDENNYIVFGAYKKPMGCITSRYIAPSTLPVPVTEGASIPMAYDVFFPQNAMWANKAALMVTALYFDYLWSE